MGTLQASSQITEPAVVAVGRWLAEATSYAFGAHGMASPLPPLVGVQPYVDRPRPRRRR